MRLFQFILVLIMVKFSYTRRHVMMAKSSGCYCRYRIEKERNLVITPFHNSNADYNFFKF